MRNTLPFPDAVPPPQLGEVMVSISSNLMLADEQVLGMAQREASACSRIVQCLQRIAVHRLANGAQAFSLVSTHTHTHTHHTHTDTHTRVQSQEIGRAHV